MLNWRENDYLTLQVPPSLVMNNPYIKVNRCVLLLPPAEEGLGVMMFSGSGSEAGPAPGLHLQGAPRS